MAGDARVGTKGDMFNLVMQRPLNTPTAAAAKRPTRIAGAIDQPLDISEAVITAVIPHTEPTERSIPPVRMTKVIPKATIPTKAKFRVMLTIFSQLENWGMKIAITRIMMINAAKLPNSLTANSFDQVDA